MKVPTLEYRYPEHGAGWAAFTADQAEVERVLVAASRHPECLALACGLMSGHVTPGPASERYGPLELRIAR